MPLGGEDTRFDLPWSEQDKIRRRLELKYRLKDEGVRRKFDPFLQMKKEHFSDPAIDRYMDLRKKGRMPNTPLNPKRFYKMVSLIFIPIILGSYLVACERRPYLEGCKSGDIPYSERKNKVIG